MGNALLYGNETTKSAAREMIEAAPAMHDRAVKMGKIPKFGLP